MRGRAFTLVELLLVMSLIVILVAVSLPAIRSFGLASPVPRAAAGLRDVLEQARMESMARQSYVWVAMNNRINSEGTAEVSAVVYTSFGGTAAAPAGDLTLLGTVNRWDTVSLVPIASVHEGVRQQVSGEPEVTPVFPGDGAPAKVLPASFRGDEVGFATSGYVTLTFTPSGELVRLPEPGAQDRVVVMAGLGLQENRGAGPIGSVKDAIVTWEGASGKGLTREIR
jgi:prepilin-type N-terminal cleavage/methylation domain-containing protein